MEKTSDPAAQVLESVKAMEQQAPPKPEETVLDLEQLLRVHTPNGAQTEEHLRVAAKLTQLETAIVYAQQAKIEWLEVEPEILKHFCRGQLPESGYYIYKNVKLCLEGKAEEIARQEGLSCHEVLFPKEGYMRVGVRRGGK